MKEKQTKIIGRKLMQGVEKQKPHKSIVGSSSSMAGLLRDSPPMDRHYKLEV